MPSPSAARSGVCIVRIETEVDRMLITLTTERFTPLGPGSVRPSVRHFANPEKAIGAVADFVRSTRTTAGGDP